MRKSILISILLSAFWTACTGVSSDDLKHLDGYWEISKVEAHGETFSPRGSAPAVDHYQMVNDSLGIKKKMVPRFGEKYNSSEDLIQYRILFVNGKYSLQFFSALEEWEEEIKSLSAGEMVLFHNDKSYHYKRHQKIAY